MPEKPLPIPPARLARVMETVRDALHKLQRRSVPAPVALLEMITAGWLSQAVQVAASLRVAEALEHGPKSAAELARELNADADALGRLLRALSQYGVFTLRRDGRFAQSALSDSLRESASGSVRAFALYVGSREHREHWSELERTVRTGAPAIQALRGQSFFEHVQESASFGALFNGAMTSVSELAQHAVLAAYDFSAHTTIADIGGGHGRLLASILERTTSARGLLFDLPQVVAGAPGLLGERGVLTRCTIESGSFFERVPSGAELYVLKHILHDWDDTRAARILRNVRAAMGSTGTLLLIESVLPEGSAPHYAKLLDLEMLLSVGGRERSEREFRSLLAASGFSLTRTVPTAGPISIVEARPE